MRNTPGLQEFMELSNSLCDIGAGARILFEEDRRKPDSAHAFIPLMSEPSFRFYEFDTNFYVARGSRSRTWDVCLISADAEAALKYFVYEVGSRFTTGTAFYLPPRAKYLNDEFDVYSIADGRTFLAKGDESYPPIFQDTIDMPIFHVMYSHIADVPLKELIRELLTPGGGETLSAFAEVEEEMSDDVWTIVQRFI